MKEGLEINQRVRLTSHDLLVSTNRPTAGVGYQRLESALERLAGTRIQTNIKTNGLEVTKNFGLIDEWETVRRDGWEGRLLSLDIKLSDWFFNALQADELLGINRDYFRLRKPLERRIYEIGRKNCGEQRELAIGLDKLKRKTGSKSPDKKFKFLIKKIVESDSKSKNFPDYGLYLNDNVLVYKDAVARIEDNANYRGLSLSALARAVGDQRYGYNLTRCYTLLARAKGHDGVLSVGRVQTPILGLVVARDRAHEGHRKQAFYTITAVVDLPENPATGRAAMTLQGLYRPVDGAPLDEKGRVIDGAFAKGIVDSVKGKDASLLSVETKDRELAAPLPYNLLALQADAAGLWRYKPKQVLEITQRLRDRH